MSLAINIFCLRVCKLLHSVCIQKVVMQSHIFILFIYFIQWHDFVDFLAWCWRWCNSNCMNMQILWLIMQNSVCHFNHKMPSCILSLSLFLTFSRTHSVFQLYFDMYSVPLVLESFLFYKCSFHFIHYSLLTILCFFMSDDISAGNVSIRYSLLISFFFLFHFISYLFGVSFPLGLSPVYAMLSW